MKNSVIANCFSVLVIEQNLSAVLCETLEDNHHLVKAVSSGKAALDLLSSFTPQLILADLVLPDMSGLKLLCLVKQQLPGTPVILLADPSDEINIAEGLELGAEDFLLKPCRPSTLLTRIRRLSLQEETGEVKLPTSAPAPPQALQKSFYGRSRQLAARPVSERQFPAKDFGLWLQLRNFNPVSIEYSSS